MTSIPDDIVIEISSWLPAKAVHKFRCTSKFYSNFSKRKYFALRQTQNTLLKGNYSFFIQPDFSQRFNGNIAQLYTLPEGDNSSGVSKDVLKFLAKSAKILSSTNGLILCRDTTSNNEVKLFIFNPATQTLLPIVIPEELYMGVDKDLKVILACDGENNCTVFLFYDNSEFWSSYLDCKVYVPNEGVWKQRDEGLLTGDRELRFDMPVFHNGAIHLISDCSPYLIKGSFYFRPYIMAYNIENGITTMLRVPKEARRGSHDISCNMGIFRWGKVIGSNQSICLVRLRKCVFTIWILTKYESSLWKRVLKIRVKAMGVMEKDPDVTSFSVLNGDLLVFSTQRKVYGYGLSLTNGNYMKIEEICEHGCESRVCFTSYSNTLCTCDAYDTRALLLHSTSFKEQQHTLFHSE